MEPKEKYSRKKFVIWGLGILSAFSVTKYLFSSSSKKTSTNEKVKFLTQDGQLVEVDVTKIKSPAKKISNEELKTWIKK